MARVTGQTTRPPFILAIMADAQGCGFHRIQMPLASMVAANVVDGRIDMQHWPDQAILAANPDVIVLQRQVEDEATATIERWKKLLPDCLFVYELDDYLGEIPADSFHAGFMPPGIPDKVAAAISKCDRVTTTTEKLAEWFRSMGATDVRVVPNALPLEKLKPREPRQTGRLRVGFAGGISHDGDLKLIEPAMAEIGEDVEWVFFGAKPSNPRCRIEFHRGVPPQMYMDVMAKLDIDLMLAPLEDNFFNTCKSNLRLIESGAIGAAVIAQDMETYKVNKPPVFGWAKTAEDWTWQIKRFMKAPVSERRRAADGLQTWVGRHYVLERILKDRMEAWLPAGAKFLPQGHVERKHNLVLATTEEKDGLKQRMPFLSRVIQANDLLSGCEQAKALGADLLWLRPATYMGEKTWNNMLATIGTAPTIASVVPMGSDGVNAFPVTTEWMPMSAPHVREMEGILTKNLRGRRFSVVTCPGPCVLISGNALRMLGSPDVEGCEGNEEQAIFEWGLRAGYRDWKHMQVGDSFVSSLSPPAQPSQLSGLRLQTRGWSARLQAVPSEAPSPEDREAMEQELLATQWGGPRPQSMGFGNDYNAWKSLVGAYAVAESRRHAPTERAPLMHTVEFGESFAPLGWCIHVDDSIKLDVDDALEAFSIAAAAAGDDVDVIYSDHETKFADGNIAPEFKPDFDLELFMAQDYITPICAVRTNKPFEDRISLFAGVLNIAKTKGKAGFVHIPRTLGTLTMTVRPEELALDVLGRKMAIDETFEGIRTVAHPAVAGCISVQYDWKAVRPDAPLVSIIVPTLGGGRLLQPCINTIRQHTNYPNWEAIVVLNGPRQTAELGEAANDPRVRVIRWDGEFNWSAINNFAIVQSKGEFIVTMNDDVCVGTPEWLDLMMGRMVQPNMGTVGARLVHPSGVVQHCGVLVHRGIAAHMHKGLPNGQLGHLGRAMLSHEVQANTGACMLFSRGTFDKVDGFNEDMPRNYNDTDFCMRVGALGLRNAVEMDADLLHSEGSSRPDQMKPESLKLLAKENALFAKRWTDPDPYWNPNMRLEMVHGGLFVSGGNGEALSWRDPEPRPDQDRVLVINDLPGAQGVTLDLMREGAIPMGADLSGFVLKMTAPSLRNTPPWDVRDPDRMSNGLRNMKVSKIVLRSMIGREGATAPVEALRCLKSLGVPIELNPHSDNLSVMRPWDAENQDAIMDTPFRSVDIRAWREAYEAIWPRIYQDVEDAAE